MYVQVRFKVLSVRNASKVILVFRISILNVFNHSSCGSDYLKVYATLH